MNKTDKKVLEYLERAIKIFGEHFGEDWFFSILEEGKVIEIAKMIQREEHNEQKTI